MTDALKHRSWLKALAAAAAERAVPLPAFTAQGMGVARSAPVADGRFVTFKRRLVSEAEAEVDGIEWTLWHESSKSVEAVAAFRESQQPHPENVAAVLSLLSGWLVERWTADEAKAAVSTRPQAQPV